MRTPRYMRLLAAALLLAFRLAAAECRARLPTLANPAAAGRAAAPAAGRIAAPVPAAAPAPAAVAAARIVAGLKAAAPDSDNIVSILTDVDEGTDFKCAGSLIAPDWVITAAQCFVEPFRDYVRHNGATSLTGFRYDVASVVPHPGWKNSAPPLFRDDLALLHLTAPVFDTVRPSPSASPPARPGARPAPTPPVAPGDPDPAAAAGPTPLPDPNPAFNFMLINNNTAFAMSDPRYLRVKGYGVNEQPSVAEQPLRFEPRQLKFADLRTAPCEDSFGTDANRRLCTMRDDSCGPCFGDVGSPLYDVDATGKGAVLVAIVTFGRPALSAETPVCTGDRPVVYTAVATYADWIAETVGFGDKARGRQQLQFFDVPPEGITDTIIEREGSSLAVFAKTSIIVISTLALLGALVALIILCTLRHLRRRRKRWVEGLHAEDSFVKAGEMDAGIVDPFEGIQNDQGPRFSLTGLSRAAVKGATDFSSRSIGAIRAMLANEQDTDFVEPREPIEDAPVWLAGAWDNLFLPPSKADLRNIHKIPTQRVVDDVLEGADRSVEPSLEEIAFKSARDEANLEAAWAKLEVKTSLRNLSEASSSTKNLQSPPMSPPLSPSPHRGSRNGSRKNSRNNSRVQSSLGSGMRKPGEFAKADTLLAAFASIDAESEQVAEETVIDSSTLRALAEAKRPNVLATLRRKFSNGPSSPTVRSDRGESDGDDLSRMGSAGGSVGGRRGDVTPTQGMGSRGTSRGALPSARSSRVPTALSSLSGLLTKTSLGSRQSSMVMDYFSSEYSLSDSDSDNDSQVAFDEVFNPNSRRYTGDRRPDSPDEGRSIGGMLAFRKSQVRSFESLERKGSSGSLPDSDDGDELGDFSVSTPFGETENSREDRVDDPGHSAQRNSFPMSTSSISSEKRPRSVTGPVPNPFGDPGAGPSTPSTVFGNSPYPERDQISVHMEEAPSHSGQIRAHMEAAPSRQPAPEARIASTQDVQREQVSVRMEEAPPQIGQTRTRMEFSTLKRTTPTAPVASPRKRDHDEVSVHMEETSPRLEQMNFRFEPRVSKGPASKGLVASQHGRDEEQISVHMEERSHAQQEKASRILTAPTSSIQEVNSYLPQLRKFEDQVSVHMEETPARETWKPRASSPLNTMPPRRTPADSRWRGKQSEMTSARLEDGLSRAKPAVGWSEQSDSAGPSREKRSSTATRPSPDDVSVHMEESIVNATTSRQRSHGTSGLGSGLFPEASKSPRQHSARSREFDSSALAGDVERLSVHMEDTTAHQTATRITGRTGGAAPKVQLAASNGRFKRDGSEGGAMRVPKESRHDEDVNQISVARLKKMWNERARRDSNEDHG